MIALCQIYFIGLLTVRKGMYFEVLAVRKFNKPAFLKRYLAVIPNYMADLLPRMLIDDNSVVVFAIRARK